MPKRKNDNPSGTKQPAAKTTKNQPGTAVRTRQQKASSRIAPDENIEAPNYVAFDNERSEGRKD